MSTGTIIAIVIIAVVVLAILAFAMPRLRARGRERKLNKARGRAAEGHREVAEHRIERARMAEAQAQRERAEAGIERRIDQAGVEHPARFERFDDGTILTTAQRPLLVRSLE